MTAAERPTALRATARIETTLFGRRKRVVRYDARYADGRIEHDVHVDEVLEGRRLPADAWTARHASDAACPELGTGSWVEYPTGRLREQQLDN
ncbi:hypothetical protein [Cellulomonas bogoriensis]|uniref:hypothetical protein n=1 Tax=Cellulomonas bogoriensis TaxID=301388 RepID=UPI0005586822|nr:hypothetical protein [Cellulomonas bogoriensis]